MNQIKDLIYAQDFFKLTKSVLQDIAAELNIDNSQTKNELALEIYQAVSRGEVSTAAVNLFENRIFSTKSSVTWYRFDEILSADDFKRQIIMNSSFDPFIERNNVVEEEINTAPVLLGGCDGVLENGVFLRFIYKDGVRFEPTTTHIRQISRTSIATVYYDANNGVLEVRGDTRKSKDIARTVAQLLNLQVTLEPIEAPYDQAIGSFADRLNGELIEAKSKPQQYFEHFSEEESKAVIDVLSALDNYISTQDLDVLEYSLQQVSETFGHGEGIIPFAALVLSGMETVGMAGNSELRAFPLYSYLSPYLNHQGGFIKFKYVEDGIEDTYTIRVGISTKSIVFVSHVTEGLIDFVRNNVII